MSNPSNDFIIFLLFLSINAASSIDYYFDFKSYMIPHPDKAYRGGEDAYYTSQDLIVIADGVGGWNNQGIDPSKFSRFLAKRAGQAFYQNKTLSKRNPRKMMQIAHAENKQVGSSTMVVMTLDQSDLRTCFLGDSGLLVLRQYSNSQTLIIYQFTQQQHSFNFPYQFAMKNTRTDTYDKSICLSIQVQIGDIVVGGSDGLFDNLDSLVILSQVKKAANDGTLLTSLPQKLAEMAIARGKNKQFMSPFAERARKRGINYIGGKLDDTTVTIARITNQSQDKKIVQQTMDFFKNKNTSQLQKGNEGKNQTINEQL